MQVRKSLLFDENIPWTERYNSSLFDVTMGSCDGADACELVGLYILNNLCNKYNRKISIGLYENNSLAVQTSPRSADKIRRRNFLPFLKALC